MAKLVPELVKDSQTGVQVCCPGFRRLALGLEELPGGQLVW